MTSDSPKVSVITPVYNGEAYLAQAIASILGQSFDDFEYWLVDDASTDGTAAILQDYAARDCRVRLLRNPINLHQSGAINTALQEATGDYIAILDADDIAHPERLARQVAFLEIHPSVGVVGSQVQGIDAQGLPRGDTRFPTDPQYSRWVIFFGTPVLHSAAMVRRELFSAIKGYSRRWRYANDYSLWAELIKRTDISNVPETLVSYRRHGQQISSASNRPQTAEVWLLIYSMMAERLQLRPSLDAIGALYRGVRGLPLEDDESLLRASALLAQLHDRYLAVEAPDAVMASKIDTACAHYLLVMAWVHRHTHRTMSRALYQNALQYDPGVWGGATIRNRLRRLRLREKNSLMKT